MCGSLVGCIDLEHRFEITAVLIKKSRVGHACPESQKHHTMQTTEFNFIRSGKLPLVMQYQKERKEEL